MTRKEVIGNAELWLGDCREILPTIGRVDVGVHMVVWVITDPPYGIKYSPGGGGRGWTNGIKTFAGSDLVRGDNQPFDPTMILSLGFPCILWGANHYADKLPPRDSWLVWDKREGTCNNDFADCELAWLSEGGPARVFRHLWNGAFRKSERGEIRVHPTQKAVAIMLWCVEFSPSIATVLDPYMGSGTTGVACAKLGRKFIGIEIELKYFDIACKRIEQAYKQPDMFIKQPKAEQITLGLRKPEPA